MRTAHSSRHFPINGSTMAGVVLRSLPSGRDGEWDGAGSAFAQEVTSCVAKRAAPRCGVFAGAAQIRIVHPRSRLLREVTPPSSACWEWRPSRGQHRAGRHLRDGIRRDHRRRLSKSWQTRSPASITAPSVTTGAIAGTAPQHRGDAAARSADRFGAVPECRPRVGRLCGRSVIIAGIAPPGVVGSVFRGSLARSRRC